MKITLEKIGKWLLLIGFVSLIYRLGNFYNTFIPKPYEIIFSIVLIVTAIDVIKNAKWLQLQNFIPKTIWIASVALYVSVIIGWLMAYFVRSMPLTVNTVLEFGTFTISYLSLFLVIWYCQNDSSIWKKYLYAFLIPAGYIVFLAIPELIQGTPLLPGYNFAGLTLNVNFISKILLIPAMFFMVMSLLETAEIWKKVTYGVVAAGVVALLIWTASRGAFLALIIAAIVVLGVYMYQVIEWKKRIVGMCVIAAILIIGSAMVPKSAALMFLGRLIGPDHATRIAMTVQQKDLNQKKKSSETISNAPAPDTTSQPVVVLPPAAPQGISDVGLNETRLQIWPVYLKEILRNPLGLGPNTHYNYHISRSGETFSTGPHNTYLQVWLWGGIIGIVSFMYILWVAFKRMIVGLRSDFNPTRLAVCGIMIALSISIAFDDSLAIYWFFIMLGLSLTYESSDRNNHPAGL